MNYLINLSWKCNLDTCSYCWVKQCQGVDREKASFRSVEEWIAAISALPAGAIDFCGGEPLIFPDFVKIIDAIKTKHNWSITTNLIEPITLWLNDIMTGCKSWTCSYHAQMPIDKFVEKVKAMKIRGYPVSINIMDDKKYGVMIQELMIQAWKEGIECYVSPLEDVADAMKARASALLCKAGSNSFVIDPEGNLYPCLTLFRRIDREIYRIGNIFQGTFNPSPSERICLNFCHHFDILDKAHHAKNIFNLDIRNPQNG